MVKIDSLITPHRRIPLRSTLSCSNYGIYVASCRLCGEQYVGQTKNSFHTRWRSHRQQWNNFSISDFSDKTALLRHYFTHHSEFIADRPLISQCYVVIFVEQPRFDKLDVCEAKWFQLTKAKINIQKMVVPQIR